MDDLQKVNSLQLYSFWKNLSIGLLIIIGLVVTSRMLPYYLSPIISIIAAIVLYAMLYTQRVSNEARCTVVIYALLYTVINYTIVIVGLNLIDILHIVRLPKEFLFINDPFLPSLVIEPVACITMAFFYIRRDHISVCKKCTLKQNGIYEGGSSGRLFRYESYYQLKNLAILFGVMSICVWTYYLFVYIELSVNSRDWYVFVWLYLIGILFDELYFIYRYYNLYLDLKERDEIISPDQLLDMTARTYLKFYVICDNYLYLDRHFIDKYNNFREIINTPFDTKRAVNGLPLPEIGNIIKNMTGVKDGELRFFYGRNIPDLKNASILRFFYFLPGKPEDYPELKLQGEWINFEEIKHIYTVAPGKLDRRMASDISRLATIILTEKIFNEDGYRKNGIKSYKPSFSMKDVKASQLDFQDDKWIKISMFNSDTPFYSIKKFFKGGKPKIR